MLGQSMRTFVLRAPVSAMRFCLVHQLEIHIQRRFHHAIGGGNFARLARALLNLRLQQRHTRYASDPIGGAGLRQIMRLAAIKNANSPNGRPLA